MLHTWLPSLAVGQIFHEHFTSVLTRARISLFFSLLLCSIKCVGFGCPLLTFPLINSRMLLDVCLSLMAHLVWSYLKDSRLTTVNVKNKWCEFKSLFSMLKSQYLPLGYFFCLACTYNPSRHVLFNFASKSLAILQDITEHTTSMPHASTHSALPFYIRWKKKHSWD